MSTSRSVDRLTYTYYTGQDGSEPHGPNCHTCMNELFHENKLMDVQMVFITTLSGLIPFPIRALVCSYGVEAPFSMTLFTEDFLVASCTQCAQKAIRLELTEATKADKQGASKKIKRKRTIKTECSLETDLVTSSAPIPKRCKSSCEDDDQSSTMVMDKTKKKKGKLQVDKVLSSTVALPPGLPCVEESFDNFNNLPFLYGRKPGEVNDPISIGRSTSLRRIWMNASRSAKMNRLASLVRLYFCNQEIVICNYCNSLFHSDKEGHQLIDHLLSQVHFNNVARAGLKFSNGNDWKRLLQLLYIIDTGSFVNSDQIPFVFGCRSTVGGICFERLFNYLKCLKRSELIDDGFFQYMLRIYPDLKDINSCSLCARPVSREPDDYGYFTHFLSSGHIAKAIENKWSLGPDFGKFISHLSKYLREEGRKDKATLLLKQLMAAANKKTYSKTNKKYKHLFEMDM